MMNVEAIRLLAKCLRRDARDFSEGLFAAGTNKTLYEAADTIEALLSELDAVKAERDHYKQLEAVGRLIELPCKVGTIVYVLTTCENVHTLRDDDYFTGTGAVECPFEKSCEFEDCDDSNIRIFETTVTDFWYGENNANHPEAFLENLGHGYMLSDFGETVFLTLEAAEQALQEASK